MIPLNLLLVVWVWIGRTVFGVGGWLVLIYLVSIVPVLLVGLLITTILAFTQPGRPRSLTRQQAWAQLSVWAGMLAFGTFSVDYAGEEDGEVSLLTRVLDDNEAALEVSWALMWAFAAVTVAAWIALLVTLVAGRRRERRPGRGHSRSMTVTFA